MKDARARTDDEKVARCGICGQWTYRGLCTLCRALVPGSDVRQSTVNPALTANRPGRGPGDDQA